MALGNGGRELKRVTGPYRADQMRPWGISPRVNGPKNVGPSLWEPLHPESIHRGRVCPGPFEVWMESGDKTNQR